jgi:hypoxanthine phosphoribosyltransferase
VLDGALNFSQDLISNVENRGYLTIQDFIRLKSYEGTSSKGSITVDAGLQYSVKDHDIIVLEDIVESGRTMVFLKDLLLERKASSVKIAAFLNKPCMRKAESLKLDYVGREIPNVFVIGYGMDLDGEYRDLPYISYVDKNE